MKSAVWKDIPGYEGLYQASIFGYIRSKTRLVGRKNHQRISKIAGYIVSPWIDTTGYLKVDLYKDGHCHCEKVHRLIAKTFIPNPLHKATVNHKDENKLNNTVTNLEWMTNKENVNYGTRIQRVREAQGVHVIRIAPNLNTDHYFTLHDAEKQTGLPRQSIAYAAKHNTNLAGYKWEVI